MTGFEYLKKQILDKNPWQYEELRPNYEGGYRCYWCEVWVDEHSEFEHKDDCLYKVLKEMK